MTESTLGSEDTRYSMHPGTSLLAISGSDLLNGEKKTNHLMHLYNT